MTVARSHTATPGTCSAVCRTTLWRKRKREGWPGASRALGELPEGRARFHEADGRERPHENPPNQYESGGNVETTRRHEAIRQIQAAI